MLSDVDLVVVLAADGQSLVGERLEIAAAIGPLVAHLDSPQNAPLGGAQLNGLYDVSPLPVFVDWNLWPTTRERPSDVVVLVERDVGFVVGERCYEDQQREMPRAKVPARDAASEDHFRFMMLTIIAKLAVRGEHESVRRMFDVIGERAPHTSDPAAVVEGLDRLLERLAPGEPPEAVACVRRYLETVTSIAGL